MKLNAIASLVALTLAGTSNAAYDEHTYANLDDVLSTHIHLDLEIDFDNKKLQGFAEHTLDWKKQTAKSLVLDTRDLEIDKVLYRDKQGNWR